MAKFDDTLKFLFKYYYNSAEKQHSLEQAPEQIAFESNMKKLSKLRKIRWAASKKTAVEQFLAE